MAANNKTFLSKVLSRRDSLLETCDAQTVETDKLRRVAKKEMHRLSLETQELKRVHDNAQERMRAAHAAAQEAHLNYHKSQMAEAEAKHIYSGLGMMTRLAHAYEAASPRLYSSALDEAMLEIRGEANKQSCPRGLFTAEKGVVSMLVNILAYPTQALGAILTLDSLVVGRGEVRFDQLDVEIICGSITFLSITAKQHMASLLVHLSYTEYGIDLLNKHASVFFPELIDIYCANTTCAGLVDQLICAVLTHKDVSDIEYLCEQLVANKDVLPMIFRMVRSGSGAMRTHGVILEKIATHTTSEDAIMKIMQWRPDSPTIHEMLDRVLIARGFRKDFCFVLSAKKELILSNHALEIKAMSLAFECESNDTVLFKLICGRTLVGNKSILAKNSTYFNSLFSHDKDVTTIETDWDFTADAHIELVHQLHSDGLRNLDKLCYYHQISLLALVNKIKSDGDIVLQLVANKCENALLKIIDTPLRLYSDEEMCSAAATLHVSLCVEVLTKSDALFECTRLLARVEAFCAKHLDLMKRHAFWADYVLANPTAPIVIWSEIGGGGRVVMQDTKRQRVE